MRGNGFAKLQKTSRGSVLREAVVERLFAGFNDVLRCRKVWSANFQMNDALARLFEGLRLCQYFKCGFGADPLHLLHEFHRKYKRKRPGIDWIPRRLSLTTCRRHRRRSWKRGIRRSICFLPSSPAAAPWLPL